MPERCAGAAGATAAGDASRSARSMPRRLAPALVCRCFLVCRQVIPALTPSAPTAATLPWPAAEYCCNGTVIEDEDSGNVLQLQGDQRKNVSAFLLENKLCKKEHIKVHGF